jgi:hypothetical protein
MTNQIEIVEREWEGWKFQSAQKTQGDTMVCYSRVLDNGIFREVVEIYSGENYVVGSTKKSYSRVYPMDKIPKIHVALAGRLKWELAKKLNKNLIRKS